MTEQAPEAPADDISPVIEVLSTVEGPQIATPSDVMTILVTLPPGSPGAPPHRHFGPAFGYVLEGEIRFEVEGQPERVIKAGESFSEPGGDVIHYQDGNNLADAQSKFIAVLVSAAGKPMLEFVSSEELEARRHLRAPRP